MPSRDARWPGRRWTAVAEAGRSVDDADLPGLIEEVFGADVAVVALGAGFDGLAASSDDAKLIVLGTSQVPAGSGSRSRTSWATCSRATTRASTSTGMSTTGRRRRTRARCGPTASRRPS